MNKKIPQIITHYARGIPFLSLTSLSVEERKTVISTFSKENTWGLNRFLDEEYIDKRIRVEEILHKEFQSRGGNPLLKNPIYFTLGRNLKFEEREGLGLKKYIFSLSDLPYECISLTYGDSLLAYDKEYSLKVSGYTHRLCCQLFRVEDLERLLTSSKLPMENSLTIEVQFWDDPNKYKFDFLD